MKKVLLFFFAPLLSLAVFSQERCGSHQHLLDQMSRIPEFAQKIKETERNFDHYKRTEQNRTATVLTIPVVVHVVYNTLAEKISLAQVQSQIDVLNADFSATNIDYGSYAAGYQTVKGNPSIQFCLVETRYVKTNKKSFSTNNGVKISKQGGSDAVDPMHALNIWVCNLSRYLGYAQFPGGPVNTFGIVVNYKAFGKGNYNLYPDYNLGRTATHEIGHCLGLRHIWGDATCGNDYVGDTPLHNGPNYGCPGVDHKSTCTGKPLEMWMNYMDYSDDKCLYFFTEGQVTRSNFFLDTDAQLLSITGTTCPASRVVEYVAAEIGEEEELIVYPSPANNRLTVSFNSVTTGSCELRVMNIAGQIVLSQNIIASAGVNVSSIDLGRLNNGIYILRLVKDGKSSYQKFIIHK